MKTIGQIIKTARNDKKYSFQNLEETTKIKTSFIIAIENENWQSLPPFPTVLGFVKSISGALDIDEKMAVAVLKRDYPPEKLNINPTPDVASKPMWNPKLTFILGITLIVVLVLGYLGFQYAKFISPPRIEIVSPVEGQIVSGKTVLIFGSTDLDIKITVDNQPVLVGSDGKFSSNVEVSPTATKVVIKAISRSGKETIIERNIVVKED
jgi:cytoskeletal protein RodZ